MSTEMLSLMSGAVIDGLPNTAALYRAAIAASALRTATKTYAVVLTSIACRIEMASPNNSGEEIRKLAEKFIGKAFYRITLPSDTDVRDDDKLIETDSEREFLVVSAANSISFPISRSVIAIEFTGA